jgi:uncharacterized protein YbaR (Trm112 family)
MSDYSILMCPITRNGLELLSKEQFYIYNLPGDFEQYGQLTSGLVDSSKSYFYPIFNEVIILLPEYAIYIGKGIDSREKMHLIKKEQFNAVNELYRVGIDNSKIVIIYNWFMHSWFMNLSLHFIQLYRIMRHYAGKLYVRLTKSKPRLYFFTHGPIWFKKSFPFSGDIEFYCWRSTNKYFLDRKPPISQVLQDCFR